MMRIGLYSEDRELQLLLSYALGKEFEVVSEPDENGISHLETDGSCDVLILDLTPIHDSLQERLDRARVLIASRQLTVVMVEEALQPNADELVELGAYATCRKPVSIRDLKTLLRKAFENSALERQQCARQQLEAANSCDRMIGSSPQMQQVYRLVHSVTNLNASVLITGESGTGKELVARAIHNLGIRSNRPFVAVSCGAIPETLLEAELFGHEKGAFTGTVGTREGHFEQVANGTLFLDEIGDLSPYAQVKLLRVLQQFEFSRLGSNRLIPLRARLVFATHQNLSEMVTEGKFRQDLFFRINVMRISAPPLRERPEDIPKIAAHFLRQYAQTYQKPVEDFDPDAMTLLQSYAWPGNVRELENVIQSAIILAHEKLILPEDLPLSIRGDNVVPIGFFPSSGSFEQQILDYKIKLVTTAIRENNGNKTLAARSLNISRAYLHRLIRLGEPDQLFEEESVQEETA
jgi:DNA-binding NtrC family response regulator